MAMGKREEPLTRQQQGLAELGKHLQGRSCRRRKERRIAAIGCLILGIGLLVVPKPETPPQWLTILFVCTVLAFTISLGWLCRGLTEDVGYGASAKAVLFLEFLKHLELTDSSEAVPAALDIWPFLSLVQKDALIPHLCSLLGRMDNVQAIQLTQAQCTALEDIVRQHSRTDAAILGLLTLASAQHQGEQLLPIVQDWARQPDRRGAAAREYLLTLGGRTDAS